MPIFNPHQVREQLSKLGKTQEDLARDIGVTAGTVNRWLTGKHKPLRVYQKLIMERLNEYNQEAA